MGLLAVDRSIYNFVDSLVHDKTQHTIFNYLDDPTVMGFNFVIDFNSSANPLFYKGKDSDSAYQYLKNIDEPDRAKNLAYFRERLKDIIFKFPFYFQSVEGMKDIYKMDPVLGWRAKDRVLEIKTLESIDLRIGNMIHKYMDAYFDTQYYREMIPQNLRRFGCWIILSEIRNFKSYFNTLQNADNGTASFQGDFTYTPAGDSISRGCSINSINSLFNCYVYRLDNCEFDFSNSNGWMNEIDQKGNANFSTNSFKIKVGTIREMHKMDIGQMTYAKDTDPVNYRKAIYGVPDIVDVVDLPTILRIEDTVAGDSWLQRTIDAIKATPVFATVSANLSPEALEDRIRHMAMNKIRETTQELIGSENVFGHSSIMDITRDILNFDFTDALNNLLNDTKKENNDPGFRKNVFGHDTDILKDRKLELELEKVPGILDKDVPSLFNTYLGNVFGHRPIASTITNGLNIAAQAASTNNNAII